MNWLYTWLGLSNASGPEYLFWSGIFGDFTIFGAMFGLYWTHTCHIAGCFRLGKHPMGHYKLCKKHHPDTPHGDVTIEHIKLLHKIHKEKAHGTNRT